MTDYTRTIMVMEAEPGIVHVTTEALHDLLTSAGWTLVDHRGDERAYKRTFAEARHPHPATMIGRP